MPDPTVQLVTAPTAAATVLLDLNNGAPWTVDVDEVFDLGVPEFAAEPNALLPEHGYRGEVKVPLAIVGTATTAVTALSALGAALQRPTTWLHFRHSAASEPVYLRLYQGEPGALEWDEIYEDTSTASVWKTTLVAPADPYLIGLRHDLVAAVAVTNNPASSGCYLNVNGVKGDAPTDALIWSDTDMWDAGAGADTLATWVGVEPAPVGTGAYYVQAEASTLGTGAALQANSALYSGAGSNSVLVTFTVAGLDDRVTNLVVPTNVPAGTYRVLVQGKPGAVTALYSCQVGWGETSTTARWNTTRAFRCNANMGFDAGLITIGGGRGQAAGFGEAGSVGMYPTKLHLRMGAKVDVAGTPTFILDYVMLLPADWSTYGLGMDAPATPVQTTAVLDGPRHTEYIVDTVSPIAGTPRTVPPAAPTVVRGGLPMLYPGNNRLHFMQLGGLLAASYPVSVSYYPRYLYLRPVGA